MKIYLVRHGQSQWQIEQGEDWDSALTAIGREQARRLGQWLASHPPMARAEQLEIASVCASPYKRAQETAVHIADALRLPLYTQHTLREANFHVAEHLPCTETPLQEPPMYEPSTTYAAFKSQVRTAFQELVERAEASNGPVLAVTHGGFIKTMLRIAMNSDMVCFRLYNTGLNLIEWKRGRWHLVHLNLWDHLPLELRTL